MKSSEIQSSASIPIPFYRSCLYGWTHDDFLEFKSIHLTLNRPRYYKVVFKNWMARLCHLKIDPKTSVHKPLVNYLWEPYKIQTLHSCLVTLFLLIFNRYVTSDSPRPHEPHTKFLCPASSSRVCSNSCPLRQWYHWPSNPLSFPSPPTFKLPQHQCLFQKVSSSHQVANILGL